MTAGGDGRRLEPILEMRGVLRKGKGRLAREGEAKTGRGAPARSWRTVRVGPDVQGQRGGGVSEYSDSFEKLG